MIRNPLDFKQSLGVFDAFDDEFKRMEREMR